MTGLRSLPSVDQLLQASETGGLIAYYGRPLTIEALRACLDEVRTGYAPHTPIPGVAALLVRAEDLLQTWTASSLLPVINATGVVLHTNLGRAPLSAAAMQASQAVGGSYSTLEFDLEKGLRGSRLLHAENLLRRLTGAEAALVVNNNAAAILLALTALARRRSAVIARTQLVEIGGGFRIPDVMTQSGARLLEVGTTNRVHLSDYEAALEEHPALVLHVHRSNFRLLGFTSEPTLVEIARLAHQAGLPLVEDLGSGALLDTSHYGLSHEPMVQESLAAGADLVCFSGDKLLGGPQAGILVGSAALITKLKKHPLARALRADKLCLAALSATLLHYLKDEAEREIPVWRMLSFTPEQIRLRAQAWTHSLVQGEVIQGESTVGGGSLPGETLPTYLLALAVRSPNRCLACLRQVSPPIIARLENDRLVLDPRTILPEQDQALLTGLKACLNRNL
jgi:L-seryl-tRNA(Ser) seleniumtransferase